MSPPLPQSATLDGLPKPFVGALRTLFDIMDDKGAGFVKFSGTVAMNCFVLNEFIYTLMLPTTL